MALNDYLGLIGYFSLVFGLVFSLLGLVLNVWFLIKKNFTISRVSGVIMLIQTLCLTLSFFCLAGLLLLNAFEYPIVFESVEKSMPWIQKLCGLWSGQSSSLLFWSLILSLAILFSSGITRKALDEKFSSFVTLILGFVQVIFLVPVLILSNPFEKIWQLPSGINVFSVFAPADAALIFPLFGMGMNPSLRHIAMLLHPPLLYLGLVGFFIPYAIVLAVLIRGDKKTSWVNLLMSISLLSWICLTLGMILGSWWAYTILGWGGYWGWDAVEIAGLLPWLLSFGLIHSLRMQMAGKNYLCWIILFSGLIFLSILSGILITRSGLLESVHAYSAGVMGPVLSVFILINGYIFLFLVIKKRSFFGKIKNQPPLSLPDLLARIFNLLILMVVAIYFFGQILPLSSQLAIGQKMAWTHEQYELYAAPFLILILITAALCPLAPHFENDKKFFYRKIKTFLFLSIIFPIYLIFGKTSSLFSLLGIWAAALFLISWFDALFAHIKKFSYQRKINPSGSTAVRNLGSILIHIGFGLMAFGIIGQDSMTESWNLEIKKGEVNEIGNFHINYLGTREFNTPEGTTIQESNFSLKDKNHQALHLLPIMEYFPKMDQIYSQPAIASNFLRDVQIIQGSWQSDISSTSDIHITVNPLMIWIWIGGGLMAGGGLYSVLASGKLNPEVILPE